MSNRPRWALSAVILLGVILIAGCSGLLANQQPPNPEPTVEEFSYPSGWSQNGITDLTVALRTNDRTVKNVSRTSRLITTDADSNRTIIRTVDTDAGTGSVRLIDTQLDTDLHRYYSPTGVFEYDRTTGKVSQLPDEDWTTANVATVTGLQRPLRNLELNATETVTIDGTAAVRYTVTGIKNPNSVPANTATGHITVVEEGFIAEFDVTRGNDGFTRRTMYDLSAVGNASVTQPAWMPDE